MAGPALTEAHRGALAALCRDVGAALARFGRALDASVAAAPSGSPAAKGQSAATPRDARQGQTLETGRKLGSRQQALLAIPALGTSEGLSSAEVAKTLGIAVPNAHAALATLLDRRLVEQVPDQRPVRWRLIERAPAKTAKRGERVSATRPKKAQTAR